MLHIKTFYCNPFRECTYIISAQEPSEIEQPCVIIDPGMYGDKEEKRVSDYLRDKHLTPVALLITHEHPDHICGREYIENLFPNIPVYGFNEIYKKEPIQIAGLTFKMLHTPGHKEDSICYYLENEELIFTGDTLFQESIGRTDLPGGNMEELLQSLAQLKQLPENTQVFPGHGFPTSIAHEKQYNPYM